MHLRGTHCVRSDGKNQISRAQSRWNNGSANARDGAEADEENCDGADSGRVHATSMERTAVKVFCGASGVVAAGRGDGAELDSVTQQQSAIRMEQHEVFF